LQIKRCMKFYLHCKLQSKNCVSRGYTSTSFHRVHEKLETKNSPKLGGLNDKYAQINNYNHTAFDAFIALCQVCDAFTVLNMNKYRPTVRLSHLQSA